MKSILVNLLQQARAALPTKHAALSSQLLQAEAQLTGQVVVDKGHLRTLLLAVTSNDSDSNVGVLLAARHLFKGTNTLDVLLAQLNEEG